MNDLAASRLAPDGRGEALFDGFDSGEARRVGPSLIVRYLRIAKRWKWLILALVTLGALVGLVMTLLTTPLYVATAKIEIQRENYRILNVDGVEPKGGAADQEFYQTQYGLLRSVSLAERVVRSLRLDEDPNFFATFGVKETAEQLRSRAAQSRTPAARQRRQRVAATILLGNIDIKPMRQSQLVDVSFNSPDPQLAARVANQWSKDFIEETLERRFEATSYARRFLEQRLEQLRGRLEESERALVSYAQQQGIVSLPATVTAGSNGQAQAPDRPLVAENLATLNREYNEAIAARVATQSRLSSSGDQTAEALQNQAISLLRQRRAELGADYAKMLTQFDPSYPPAEALQAQIAQIDRSIAREEGRVRGTLRAAYEAAAAREAALGQRVAALRDELVDLRNRSIQYNIHQREVDTNRQLYDGLLQRYKEIGVAGGVGVNNVSVVDIAKVPEQPSSPRLVLNVLLALMIGGVIGVGLALALDQIDEAISDPTEIERLIGLPLLGTVPNVGEPRTELENPKSPLLEAYLSVQTSLAFTTDHGIPRSLMVTSTRPAEGKSTSSYAMARSLARTGGRVILIDGDMRSPSLHGVFGVSNQAGLSNFLAGGQDLESLIRRHDPTGLSFMTAGPQPPNAAELLTGDRLPILLAELGERFDHIVIDAPPVMGLADAPLIASHVEGLVFVVQAHATRATVINVAIGRLRDARARLLGVLLTKFESRKAEYGYGYDYGYGYGGDSGERSSRDA